MKQFFTAVFNELLNLLMSRESEFQKTEFCLREKSKTEILINCLNFSSQAP